MSRIVSLGGPFTDSIIAAAYSSSSTSFLSASSLTLTLSASSTEPFIYDIGGRRFMLTANQQATATDNAHNFWYIDDTETLGRSALPCYYTWIAPTAPATDQHWFDLTTAEMKRYSGTAWVAVNRVFIGYTRADSGSQNTQTVCEPVGATPWWRVQNFGTADDGFLDLDTGATSMSGMKRYAAIVVRGTASIVASAAASGILLLRSQGIFVLLGTASINLDGLGRPAGAGGTGAGSSGSMSGMGGGGGGGGGGSTGAGGSGGIRALAPTHGTGTTAAGGAIGAAGTAGTTGSLSSAFPFQNSMGMMWTHGAGGGGGGGSGSAGGNGGAGGGGIIIGAAVVVEGSGTSVTAKGANGTAGAGAGRGGGGGGAGGVLYRAARGFVLNGTASAAGGTGGAAGGGTSGAGGDGGAGLNQYVRV